MQTEQQNKALLRRVYMALLFDGMCASGASVILPLLRERFALDYDFTGLLLALLSVGNIAAALLFGVLPRYIGARKTALLFGAGMFAGYLALSANGMAGLLMAGFLLIGLAKGASMNHGVVLVGHACDDRTKGVNMINAMYALGSLLVPLLYIAAGADVFPWCMPLLVLAVAGGMMWLIFFSIKENSPPAAKAAASQDDKGELAFLRERHFWYSTALLFGQQCAEVTVIGWLVTYYKDQGIITGVFSELTATVIWVAMLIMRLFIAFVLPQNSKLRSLTLMSAAAILTYALMLMANTGITAMVTLFLFGLSMAGIYPTAIAQASKGLSNASVGVQLPIGGIGAIAMPYITGAVAERAGLRGGMACSMAALIWMLVFAILLRRCDKQEAAQ